MANSADARLTERTVRRDEMIDALVEEGRQNGAETPAERKEYRELLENMPPEELAAEYEKYLG